MYYKIPRFFFVSSYFVQIEYRNLEKSNIKDLKNEAFPLKIV